MIRVKFHQNFEADEQIYYKVLSMSPNNKNIWKNIKVVSDDDYDIFVILNCPTHQNYDRSRTIVFNCETKSTRDNLSTFYKGIESEFLYIHDTENHFNVDLWYHGLTFDQLNNEEMFQKNKNFSVINSNLNNLSGHIIRNNFIKYMCDRIEYDLFGRFPTNDKNYKGRLVNKYDGLIGYKYTFNHENDIENNYFTEKLLDGIFCECLTFYGGCPNIEKFINPNSFIKLNLENFEESFNVIRDVISNDLWKDYVKDIKEEKRRIMVDYNILNIVSNILEKI